MVEDPDAVIVLVAARDALTRDHLEAAALAHDDRIRVIGTIGRREAVLRVTTTYDLPSGCPDIVVIDEGLAEASFLDEELARSCPGVRRMVMAPDAEHLDELARVVDDCIVA